MLHECGQLNLAHVTKKNKNYKKKKLKETEASRPLSPVQVQDPNDNSLSKFFTAE